MEATEAQGQAKAQAQAQSSSSSGSNSDGQVLEIVSIQDYKVDGKPEQKFVLNKDNLKIVIQNLKAIEHITRKLAIVSVVGAFRTGKSFLLSTFLRYLKTDKDPEAGYEWLKEGVFEEGNPNDQSSSKGFLWKAGQEKVTYGLSMYSKPYVRTVKGEKVAVVLMDTQGLFDFSTSQNLTAAIVGLSTLISSYQIFNVKTQIQENTLQELNFFTQFSKIALGEYEKSLSRKQDKVLDAGTAKGAEALKVPSGGTNIRAFQRLEFLVRDFIFEDEDNIEKCVAEGKRYLEEFVMKENEFDKDGARAQIKAAFEAVECTLLPHPGKSLTKSSWDGNLASVDEPFKILLDRFTRRVMDENLIPKKFQGRTVDASALERYIEAYVRVFEEGKLPQMQPLVTALSVAANLTAKDEALKTYKLSMHPIVNGPFLEPPALADAHTAAYRQALESYDEISFGEVENVHKVREELKSALLDELETIKQRNKMKVHGALEKFIFPLMVAVAAFILDTISDYTCDPWSRTCREASRVMALVYYTVIVVLGFTFYRIYQSGGSVATGMAAMSLGQATFQKIESIQERIKGGQQQRKQKSD